VLLSNSTLSWLLASAVATDFWEFSGDPYQNLPPSIVMSNAGGAKYVPFGTITRDGKILAFVSILIFPALPGQ
jgi:hypothetical protein